jgi:hypothetical protein
METKPGKTVCKFDILNSQPIITKIPVTKLNKLTMVTAVTLAGEYINKRFNTFKGLYLSRYTTLALIIIRGRRFDWEY